MSTKEVSWISSIELEKEYVVQILKGNIVQEQFRFDISNYAFKNEAKKDLCLFVNALYLTWQLYKVEETGAWCPCWSSEVP